MNLSSQHNRSTVHDHVTSDLKQSTGTNHVRTTNRCRGKYPIDEASSYRTYAGHWKQRDEPDEEEQYRQAERINQVLKARREKASRERLKQKGAVPTKNGKKLFDEFMREAKAILAIIEMSAKNTELSAVKRRSQPISIGTNLSSCSRKQAQHRRHSY